MITDVPIRGEDGVGTWTIVIMDGVENEITGSLVDWRITLWGEAIDAEKAELLPLPGANGDNNSDTAPSADVKTTTLATSTSSDTAKATENPTDHVTRPVNSKPTETVPGLSN